ncbi:enoyl-CoA hydratase [Parvibaculum sp.]|jgi:enoyl-CoA hydratase/carnithine racemase|uniref:enoyl-CoA hydratase n=1 Tax=Parvibaculum sp. TaxID=2024848 RepID=UPI001B1B58FB|nr:enoyl-CoA hydratase [Parvibaculum sp.]MBO6634630.1 enoyl-CoA hydratase [Parvibaculum sp.]MBO6678364.1 enoyl-CoA hydratase [Parvibaculum sp.]MBO6684120.1 enoyl-CoA hydratase [Parvibaculum sp.]MBO6903687.1 enoyl-CoA hydratase [Parvibaculum sp.]
MTDHVLVTVEDGVQIVTINRPDKKNALTAEMYKVLADAIEIADADPKIRVTYYTGTGGSFTAGNDLGDFAKAGATPVDEKPAEKPHVTRFLENLAEAKKPVVAAVNGLAVGVGVTMLLHCDLVYAGTSATFQMPFVNLGLVPEAGSTFLLQRQIGIQKAADLFLTGKKIDAAKAEAIGLVADVFPDNELPVEALQRAKALAAKAPNAVRATKALLKDNDRPRVGEAREAEGRVFASQLRSDEVKEAISAFFEKRTPDFSKFG